MKWSSPKTVIRFIFGLFMILALVGCKQQLQDVQLEKIAKDWAMIIRASQVIPVYPLTDDLQPGDILLVSAPVEEQVKIYKEKGFLPLDQLLKRIYSVEDFKKFYESKYDKTNPGLPPWKMDHEGNTAWQSAPGAAFPSYRFAVQTGAGLNLAIPIQGVPFALGFMNFTNVNGIVTLSDAHTFGLDNYSLYRAVLQWSQQIDIPEYLGHYRNQYLRIISRIYVVGEVNVTINNDTSKGANANADAISPFNLIKNEFNTAANNPQSNPGATDQANNPSGNNQNGNQKQPNQNTEQATVSYQKMLEAINNLIKDNQGTGAGFKVVAVSSNSISLTEKFSKPLVIGYNGFDIPILDGGRIGVPFSTINQLTGKAPVYNLYSLATLAHIYQSLSTSKNEKAKAILVKLDQLEGLLPATYPFSRYITDQNNRIVKDPKKVTGALIEGKGSGFQVLLTYLADADRTIKTLENNPGQANLESEQSLQAARTSFNSIMDSLAFEPTLKAAANFVFEAGM